MYQIIKKKVEFIPYERLSLHLIRDIFDLKEKEDLIVVILKDAKFYASVTFADFQNIFSQAEFLYFCKYEMVREWCRCDRDAGRLFEMHKKYNYILAENSEEIDKNCNVYCRNAQLSEAETTNLYYKMNECLKRCGVNSYIVRIPTIDEVSSENRHPECNFWLSHGFNWTDNQNAVREHFNKISDKSYESVKEEIKKHRLPPMELGGNYEWRIFLVGPCIVNGQENILGETLIELLHSALESKNMHYKIVKVPIAGFMREVTKRILEYDIYEKDIVIFIHDIFQKCDLDLTYLYNEKYDKWLYMDVPAHTTKIGNELICGSLIDKIIYPVYKKSIKNKGNNLLMYRGERQLSNSNELELKEYVDMLSKYKKENGICGAVVANCNPFTLGHRYLIEYASQKVDTLYVFVVEEDASTFSFEDRIRLVREGVRDLKNVIVIRSGKLILSRDTFSGYFQKEESQDNEVDASTDIFLFGRHIAPVLNIQVRFVGTEPKDKVTRMYHMQLKEQLPQYGVDLVEIPRKEVGEYIISASVVRKKWINEEWDCISKLVPAHVLHFLQYEAKLPDKKREKDIKEKRDHLYAIKRFVEEHEQIVWYGTGKNAEILIRHIDNVFTDRILYCDRKAEKSNYMFNGKTVLSPLKVHLEYKNYYIFITSPIYCKQIFCELVSSGFDQDRIMCNVIDWNEFNTCCEI